MRILLADDHTLVRAGIRALLERMPGVEVVAEASDGRVACCLAESLKPDLVMVDVVMPTLNGLEAATRIAQSVPGTRIMMLSMYSNEEYVIQALRSGACGYLLKDAAATELAEALAAIARGETYLSPAIANRVTEERLASADLTAFGNLNQLSDRQREILQLLAEGKTVKEIGFLLNLSVKTVETHRARLMDRLAVRDLPGLVRLAVRAGVVPADQ